MGESRGVLWRESYRRSTDDSLGYPSVSSAERLRYFWVQSRTVLLFMPISSAMESMERPSALRSNIFARCTIITGVIPDFTSFIYVSLCSIVSDNGFGVLWLYSSSE